MARRKTQIIIFLILVFITFCSNQSLWKNWAFLATVSFLLLLVGILKLFILDYIFLNEGDFVYDPDYNHWIEVNSPKDFQFETDFVTMKDKDQNKKLF